MELKKCADRSFKNRVDTEADKPFELPAVKLSDGKKAEDYMPEVRSIFANSYLGKDGKTVELKFEDEEE